VLCRLEFHCVANRMLRNHIQNIAFITFLDVVITFQKYIYGTKIPSTFVDNTTIISLNAVECFGIQPSAMECIGVALILQLSFVHDINTTFLKKTEMLSS
jgi:hypothetical protein